MKKMLIFVAILVIPFNVFAKSNDVSGYEQITATCTYKYTEQVTDDGENKVYYYTEFSFANLSGVDTETIQVGIKAFENIDNGDNTIKFSTIDGIDNILNYNYNSKLIEKGIEFDIVDNSVNVYRNNSESTETLNKAAKSGKFCPKYVYEVVNSRYYMFCNDSTTCLAVNEYLNENYANSVIRKQTHYSNAAISNIGQSNITQTDIKEEYADVYEEKEDACDEESENYDAEKCAVLDETMSTLIEQAEDQGITEKELKTYVASLYEFSTATEQDCESLLGDPNDEDDPAYYLMTAFNIIKYVAILLLIILSMFDMINAVASHDSDILKKAFSKIIKRLIICVVIFLFPILLKFLLELINEKASDCISAIS